MEGDSEEITKTRSASSEEVVEGDSEEITKTIPASSEEVLEGESVEITKTFITIGLRPTIFVQVILRNSEKKTK